MSERYVRYAEVNKPTRADAIIAQNRSALFISPHPFILEVMERRHVRIALEHISIGSFRNGMVHAVSAQSPAA